MSTAILTSLSQNSHLSSAANIWQGRKSQFKNSTSKIPSSYLNCCLIDAMVVHLFGVSINVLQIGNNPNQNSQQASGWHQTRPSGCISPACARRCCSCTSSGGCGCPRCTCCGYSRPCACCNDRVRTAWRGPEAIRAIIRGNIAHERGVFRTPRLIAPRRRLVSPRIGS
jgi:hypothetical protein